MQTLKHFRLIILIALLAFTASMMPLAHVEAATDVPCDTTALVDAIQDAVDAGGAQALSLATDCTYTLTVVNNGAGTRDANGLPVIANNVNLTIVGNNAIIERDANAPQFRILQIALDSTLTISAVTIRGGNAVDEAGNIFAGWGGGISNAGTLNISYSNILNNRAGKGAFGGGGGGIYSKGTLIMSHTNVSKNVSGDGMNGESGGDGGQGGDGGGILNNGNATITHSAIYANKAGKGGNSSTGFGGWGGSGGGIIHYSGTLLLANSTLSGNKAGKGGKSNSSDGGSGGMGGGLVTNGPVTIINSTIAKNKAGLGGQGKPTGTSGLGAGIAARKGTKLSNTIVADNAPGANCFGNSFIKNVGNNLDTGTSCGFGAAKRSKSNALPNLVKLEDNGGFTRTHAFKSPSDALNKGKDSVCSKEPINNQDQRGMTRPHGTHCDIGAFELQ